MNNLRIILLLLGLVILIGLYVRERLRGRKPSFSEDHLDDETEQQDYSGFRVSTRAGRDEDYASVLSSLKKNPACETPEQYSPGSDDRGRAEEKAADGLIITLHVVAVPGRPYTGPALRTALDELGLLYGDMRIYHHYGIGDMKAERPLFHLANMLEPGYFDPDHMDDLQTRGVSLFMRLPTELDAEVVFDLMLNTAHHLAENLGGEVVTHDRQPLREDYIEGIRAHLRGK